MTPRTEQWADAYRAGQTIAAIARTHRVASSVVQRALSRAGVPMRGPGPAPTATPRPERRAPGRPAGKASQAVRVLRMVEILYVSRELGELADLLDVSVRTVRRDLDVIGKVLPVTRDGDRYRVESRRSAQEGVAA